MCWRRVRSDRHPIINKVSLSLGTFPSQNLLYLHNCRHDVRRHIREAKCVDIRHKTTCRVTIDTCPLLSFLFFLYRTSQMAQIWKQTTARETQGTKTEITKSATPVKSNQKKILVSFSINRLVHSFERSVTFHTRILLMSCPLGAHGGVVKQKWLEKSLAHQITSLAPDNRGRITG